MPMLNEDARSHWLGRDNVGYAMIKGKQMPVLLDMGANVNIITPEWMVALGLQMGPLTDLHEGGITIDQPFNYEGRPIGYVIMGVQIDGISGYNEDQVALVVHSSAEFAHHVPIILGTPTMDRVIKTLKESEIDWLATPWACARKSTLLWAATTQVAAVRADVAMKPINVMGYEEPICLLTAEVVEPFETLVVKARTKITFTAGHLCCSTLAMDSKDGGLCFCIDFRKLNARTKKDSYPLPHIQEMLESLEGSCIFSTFDFKLDFWQVEMDKASNQYTAFTVGSLGFFGCECMPFGLCNVPMTFQRLMQNCLGKLNLTYCLIYLDDVITFSTNEDDHLCHMRVIFDRFRAEHLKLKPSKCSLFHDEIVFLAHRVMKDGVQPSEEHEKANWPKHLPELIQADNGMRSAITGYSLHYLLFGYHPRFPIDLHFPTI